MNKIFYILFILLTAQGYVCAANVEYRIYNFNTLQPVYQANVSLYNGTYISQTTDNYGIAEISATTGYYNVTVYKAGYTSYNSIDHNISNDETNSVSLVQLSTEGIIKLTINDLTFSTHKICLYYSNGRIDQCYSGNDTIITIHNNMNYTIVPDVNKMDLINNPDNYWLYLPTILGILGVLVFIIAIIAVIIGAYHILRGKKG